MSWMKTNQKMLKILNGALRTISIEMLLTILLLMINSRTEHYVVSFISKFNLLFLVTLAMFNKKNEKKKKKKKKKKNQIKFLIYCLDKKIKNLVVHEIKFLRKFLKCPDREIKFPRKLANFATGEKNVFSQPQN